MQDNDIALRAAMEQLAIEPPATNLAERIIAATKPARTLAPRASSVWDVLAELLLPKPAFALVCALVMGIVLGTHSVEPAPKLKADSSLENFLKYEGDIL